MWLFSIKNTQIIPWNFWSKSKRRLRMASHTSWQRSRIMFLLYRSEKTVPTCVHWISSPLFYLLHGPSELEKMQNLQICHKSRERILKTASATQILATRSLSIWFRLLVGLGQFPVLTWVVEMSGKHVTSELEISKPNELMILCKFLLLKGEENILLQWGMDGWNLFSASTNLFNCLSFVDSKFYFRLALYILCLQFHFNEA